MEKQDRDLLERLIPIEPELQVLWNQHQKYEKQLEKLERKNFLNIKEQAEKKKIQVAKLAGRTKIEQILMKHR